MKLIITLCAALLMSGCVSPVLDAMQALSAGGALVSAVDLLESTNTLGAERLAAPHASPGDVAP
jgi:hypothetical protein